MHIPRSSSAWWWGGVLLGMILDTLRLWLLGTSGVMPRTEEEYETKVTGHWGRAVAFGVMNGVWTQLPVMLVLTLLVQAPCRGAAAVEATTGAAAGAEEVAAGAEEGVTAGARGKRGAATSVTDNSAWYAGVALGGFDQQTVKVSSMLCCVSVVTTTLGVAIVGGSTGIGVALICTYAFGAFYLLPRAAARWLAEGGGGAGGGGGHQGDHKLRGRKLASFVIRALLVGAPLALLNANLTSVLHVMSAQQLSFMYPYVLSFVEYLAATKLHNDRVVEGHSDEALSVMGRWTVATMEAGRVGLLVVTYTTGAGTFQGFVLATLNGVLVEVLGRMGVLAMTLRALRVQWNHGWRSSWCGGASRPRFRLLPLMRMGRFKRVYLGCKKDTAFWPVYILAILGILDYGMFPSAHDPATGELLPALHCGADVVLVVGGGELVTQACVYGATWAVARWLPDYSLHKMVVSVRPHGSLMVTQLVWLYVGMVTLNGITGSGGLVKELEERSSGGEGGG